MALEIASVTYSTESRPPLTLVGDSADSPEPIPRPSPATGHEADIVEVEDPSLGYDADILPSQQPSRQMRSTSRAGPLRG
jgi:hypothetical protein